MVDIYDPSVLNRVVDKTIEDTNFLTNLFFPEISVSDEETVMFDQTENRQLASAFVSPLKEGRLVTELGYATKSFRPAYIKDKRVFDPNKAFRRLAGEAIGGTLSPAQRLQAKVAQALSEQVQMFARRKEVMAADVLLNGTATFSGRDYPTTVVDFGRSVNNRKVLTSTARWGEAGVSPCDNVEAWAQQVTDSEGFAVTDVIMTVDAWNLYKVDTKLEKLLDITRRELEIADLATGPRQQPRAGAIYRGRVGSYRIWTYSGVYMDPEDSTVKPILPAFTVLVGGRGMDGVQHFGAIRDLKAGIQARQYFVKSWEEEDPSRRLLLMQSAPIFVPYRPNSLLAATVR